MFNEQAFCPEVSVGTHTGAHSLNQVGGQESDFEALCLALSQVKGGHPESYGGGNCV